MAGDVEFDRDYGYSVGGSWVPAPRFALRRRRILALTESLGHGRILETGTGAAALLRDFGARNFDCTGYETSVEARSVAERMTADLPNVRIVDRPGDDWPEKFDYLLSCEVLEHIDDDRRALAEWVSYLKPGGIAVLAVPCHMSRFGPLDEWAGHLRRYERDGLVGLIRDTGLELVHLETYGFPLANLTSMLRNRMLRKSASVGQNADQSGNTARSGVERGTERRLYRLQTNPLGRLVMRTAFVLQYLFRRTELGDGFVALARKPERRATNSTTAG